MSSVEGRRIKVCSMSSSIEGSSPIPELEIQIHRFIRFVELFPLYSDAALNQRPDQIFVNLDRLPMPLKEWYAEKSNVEADRTAYKSAAKGLKGKTPVSTINLGSRVSDWERGGLSQKLDHWVKHCQMSFQTYDAIAKVGLDRIKKYMEARGPMYTLSE